MEERHRCRALIRRRMFTPLLLAGLAFSLSGCASNDGMVSKAMQAVGLKKAAPSDPSKIDLSQRLQFFAGNNLNAGNDGKPLALVVKVYHLRSLQRFQQANFDSFLDAAKEREALGTDLIDSREMLILPAQHYDATESMTGESKYLGVVALFRDPAPSRWRFVYDSAASKSSGITLGLHACALTSTSGKLVTTLADSPSSLSGVRCPDN